MWVFYSSSSPDLKTAELQVKKEDTLNAMRLVRACQKSIAVKGPVTMET